MLWVWIFIIILSEQSSNVGPCLLQYLHEFLKRNFFRRVCGEAEPRVEIHLYDVTYTRIPPWFLFALYLWSGQTHHKEKTNYKTYQSNSKIWVFSQERKTGRLSPYTNQTSSFRPLTLLNTNRKSTEKVIPTCIKQSPNHHHVKFAVWVQRPPILHPYLFIYLFLS